MNQNTPHHPEDASNHDIHADAHGSTTGNPYAARYQQAATPDLDAAAPQLKTGDVRRMNLRALSFLVGVVALLLFTTIWMIRGATHRNSEPPKPREEVVTVPDAPKPGLPPSPLLPQQTTTQRTPEPIPLAPPLPATPPQTTLAQQRSPSLMERRMMGGSTSVEVSHDGAPSAAGNGTALNMMRAEATGLPGFPDQGIPLNAAYGAKPLPNVSSAQGLTAPDTLMLRGTFIRCVLETRIVTDIPGFTSCIVTEPVYSFNGKHLLLPKGSKVLGKYDMEPNGPRVAVIWDRIVTPTGIDVNMASPGVDNLGGAGHPGRYNAHWGSRIGSALLISMLSDAFKYEAAVHGPTQTTISNGVVTQTPFESNTAQTVQNLANQAVRRAANRPATVTINQGTVLTVYVAKDVDFSGVVARY